MVCVCVSFFAWRPSISAGFFFFKQKTAYEMDGRLEFRRVLFRSLGRYIGTYTPILGNPRAWRLPLLAHPLRPLCFLFALSCFSSAHFCSLPLPSAPFCSLPAPVCFRSAHGLLQ